MTHGLGKAQRLILDTLAAIESERGPGTCRRSDLLKEAYGRSPLLQAKVAARITAKEKSRERMRIAAESGDIDAVRSYALNLINDGWPTPSLASREGGAIATRAAVGLTEAGRAATLLAADVMPSAKDSVGSSGE